MQPLHDAKGGQELYVHRLCALWSPEVCRSAHPNSTARHAARLTLHEGTARPAQCTCKGLTSPASTTHLQQGQASIKPHKTAPLCQVFQTEAGTLRNVLAAVRRGRQMQCRACGRRGATLGCLLERCPCSFHLPCARAAGVTFHCADYTVACKDHAHLYPPRGGEEG